MASKSEGRLAALLSLPRRVVALLARGDRHLVDAAGDARRGAQLAEEAVRQGRHVHGLLTALEGDLRKTRREVAELRREVRVRLLQYHHVLGRFARAAGAADTDAPRLSGRTVPLDVPDGEVAGWEPVGQGVEGPDPEGREWVELDACPVCEGRERSGVSPWNKLILTSTAPDQDSARYDYSLCHGCGVLFAARRPTGSRYRFLLAHFGEVTAKRGGQPEISNRVLNPYPLSNDDRAELSRRAAHGVFVSDHLGLPQRDYLPPLMRDRFENSVHVDILGFWLEPRGARVLEVRSRAGTVLDGLRRAWQADVHAMPIWESQQYLLREVFQIPTSDLIDFDGFTVPFDGTFDLIVANHMLTHVLRPRAFFAELHRALKPGGHLYLYNEPDDTEYLAGNQSMLATLNPLHMQALDQASLIRALAANGFETVFIKKYRLKHLVLARRAERLEMTPMTERQRRKRTAAYQVAFDRAVLTLDEGHRSRVSALWPEVVARAVASGVAEYDERGQLRLVARAKAD